MFPAPHSQLNAPRSFTELKQGGPNKIPGDMPSTGFRDAVTDGVAVRSPPAGMRALALLPRVVRKRAQDENWHQLVLAWQFAAGCFRASGARTKRAVLTALGTLGQVWGPVLGGVVAIGGGIAVIGTLLPEQPYYGSDGTDAYLVTSTLCG